VRTVKEIQGALWFASANRLKVWLAGARHSMGGHAFLELRPRAHLGVVGSAR
jgi:hypothetical protein